MSSRKPPLFLLILASVVGLPVLMTLFFMLFAYLYSLPEYLKLESRKPAVVDGGIVTVEDAVRALSVSGRSGWELVAAAQNLVARKMEYSRRNNWDTPSRAFERGMGYCQQQSDALALILKGLSIPCRSVQSIKNRFPPMRIQEYMTRGGICGHAWLRVTLNGETKDVCPGNVSNTPGRVHFVCLAKVTPYDGIPKLLGHFGAAMLNVYWDRQAVRSLQGGGRNGK